MKGTALIYSSHDRSNYIHNDLIVQRALRGRDNKRILFLPMSETVQNGSEMERQEFSWGTFRYFFSHYERYGLEAVPFFWSSHLSRHDVDVLWHLLWSSEVVILGGGHSRTGLARYKHLGERFDGERGKFGRILHERAARGLLTVGFSAGADQMCEYTFNRTFDVPADTKGFGMVRNVMCTLHHDPGRNGDLHYAARRFPETMVFGLPNDSGLNVQQGRLASGNWWQVIEFITDNSWDDPRDSFHIRTRHGGKIEHFYNDGRHWGFGGGDMLVRIQSEDNRFHDAWTIRNGRMFHYWSQQPSGYHGIEHVLASH